MSYIEQTGVKGYNTPVYSIQELNLTQLKMLKEGIDRMKIEIVNAENTERHKLLNEIEELQNSFKEAKI